MAKITARQWLKENVKVGWIAETLHLPIIEAVIPIMERFRTDVEADAREEITKLRGDVYAHKATARAAELAWREAECWRALKDITHNDLALAIKQVESDLDEALPLVPTISKVRETLELVAASAHVFVGGYEIDAGQPAICQVCERHVSDALHISAETSRKPHKSAGYMGDVNGPGCDPDVP